MGTQSNFTITTDEVQPLKKCESLYCIPVIYIIVYNYAAAAAKSLQSCPTLSDLMDCSPPGSSVHGIFQARVLEWGAIMYNYTLIKKEDNEQKQNSQNVTTLLLYCLRSSCTNEL